jgi:hypothetical protein
VIHLRNQILAMSIATILVLSTFGVAMLTLTPVPVYAPTDGNIDTVSTTDNDDTDNDDTDTIGNTDNDDTDTIGNTDNDDTDTIGNTDNDDTDTIGNTDNDNDILPFLIAVIECFTNNDEEFSDDVQLCLYDVIEVYFDDDDNSLNSNNANSDSNNNLSSNDDDNDNNGTSLQET